MFKNLSLLLTIPSLLFATATLTMDYTYDREPTVEKGIVCLKGCRAAREGFAPMVAVQPVTVMIPRGFTVTSCDIQYNDLIVLKRKYEVKPFRPAIEKGKSPWPGYYTERAAVYSKNAFYPEPVRSNWFNVQYKSGVPIVYSSANPVQYNPVTGELKYNRKVSVSFTLEPVTNEPAYQMSPAQKSFIEILVDNKEAVENLPLTTKDADDYEYLIVSMDALKDGWTALVDFNKRRGMRTRIQTISYVLSNMTGSDNAEKLRNYIKQEYTNNKISFVMLGGDAHPSNATYIPDRGFRAEMYDNFVSPDRYNVDNDLCADMYFECLDGTWKGSTYWGEAQPGVQDMTWEVFAGRFPVTTTAQLTNAITKTVKYSETPVADHINHLLMAGNYLWTNGGVACYGDDNVEEFIGTSTHNGFTTIGFPRNEFDIDSLYDRKATWTITQFRSEMNTHYPSVVCHGGHGGVTLCFNESSSNVNETTYKANGTNGNFAFLLSDACYPADFDGTQECILEKWIEIGTSAYAAVGNCSTGWGDDDGSDGAGDRPLRFIWDCMFNPNKKMHNLQCLHAGGKEANAEIVLNKTINDPPYFGAITFSIYETNLLGDPAVSVWTKTPQTFTPDYPNPLSANTFVWNTKNPYTWVALANMSDSIITTQWSDKAGNINITDDVFKQYVAANPSGKFKVIVKAHNYYPFKGECSIGPTAIINSNSRISFGGIKFIGKNTVINYTLKTAGLVAVSLYNAKGLLIKAIVNEHKNAGNHSATLDRSSLSNGIYYCSMIADNNKYVEKIVVSR